MYSAYSLKHFYNVLGRITDTDKVDELLHFLKRGTRKGHIPIANKGIIR